MKKLSLLVIIILSFFFFAQAKIFAQETCKEGYTCPDSSAVPLPGETIHYNEDVGSPPSGKTGPDIGKLNVPNLDNENAYYSNTDMLNLSLPSIYTDTLKFDPIQFNAQIAHPGCGDLILDRTNNKGKIELDKSTSKFDTTNPYNNLFLVTNYVQSFLVPQNPTTLQFTATQPNLPEPPTNTDCANETGASLDKTPIVNPEPGVSSFWKSFLDSIMEFFNSLLNCPSQAIQGKKCTVNVDLHIQEVKGIPGEKQFADQTVQDQEGYLNFYKPAVVPFPKDGPERDQDEKSQYLVFGKTRSVGDSNQVGVTYEGMSSFKTGTCGLINSLYPADSYTDTCFATTVNPSPVTTVVSAELLKIPYRTPVEISDYTKQLIIAKVKQIWPNSKIDQNWSSVVNAANQAGINTAFALAVWIEESGAGHYSNNFSCPPSETDFGKSLNCFVNTTLNSPQTPNFEQWAGNYCGAPAPGQPVCGVNAAGHDNSSFLTNLNYWYNQFATIDKVPGVN